MKRLTNDEFVNRLAEVNQTVEPIGEYHTAKEKILVRCKECGHTWLKTPCGLLRGQGCPECGRERNAERIRRMARSRRKTHERFLEEVAERNPNVIVIGRYVDAKTKVEVMCRECGATKMAYPSNILAGCGCTRHRAEMDGKATESREDTSR